MNHSPYSVSEQQTVGDLQSFGPGFDPQIRNMQVIVVALVMGVLIFGGAVVVITLGNIFGLGGDPGFLTILAAGFAGLAILNQAIIPGVLTKSQFARLEEQPGGQQNMADKARKLLEIYQTRLVIGLALLEGAAFFNLVSAMIDRHVISAIAVTALLALMLFRFPTKTRVLWWVQDRLRE